MDCFFMTEVISDGPTVRYLVSSYCVHYKQKGTYKILYFRTIDFGRQKPSTVMASLSTNVALGCAKSYFMISSRDVLSVFYLRSVLLEE
jgi:hypothetical protein